MHISSCNLTILLTSIYVVKNDCWHAGIEDLIAFYCMTFQSHFRSESNVKKRKRKWGTVYLAKSNLDLYSSTLGCLKTIIYCELDLTVLFQESFKRVNTELHFKNFTFRDTFKPVVQHLSWLVHPAGIVFLWVTWPLTTPASFHNHNIIDFKTWSVIDNITGFVMHSNQLI